MNDDKNQDTTSEEKYSPIILAIGILVIGCAVWGYSAAFIWSVNQLFDLGMAYTQENLAAVTILTGPIILNFMLK